MNWLNLFALGGLLLGFISAISGLRFMRSRMYPQAEIAWKQPSLSMWRYETLNMVTITIHSLGLLCLTASLLFNVTYTRTVTSPPNLSVALLSVIVSPVAVMVTAYMSGITLAYHFVRPWIEPVSYGICNDGLLYGGVLIGWKSYSHYETGPDDGLISLYSSYSPEIRSWIMKPPPELFSGVLGIIQRHLSSTQPFDDSMSWQRSPLTLIIGMAMLTTGLVVPAIWGLLQDQSWVWIYAFMAFFLLELLGNRLITIFDGRGKYKEQKAQTA